MDGSAIYLLLFLLCEFLVGAIVGASLGKSRPSGVHGLVISTALGLVVVVYVIIVDTVAISPFSNNSRPMIVNVLGAVVGTLMLGFCPVLICLFVACAGCWSAFVVCRRLGIGPDRITRASIFAFITILAAITALATMGQAR